MFHSERNNLRVWIWVLVKPAMTYRIGNNLIWNPSSYHRRPCRWGRGGRASPRGWGRSLRASAYVPQSPRHPVPPPSFAHRPEDARIWKLTSNFPIGVQTIGKSKENRSWWLFVYWKIGTRLSRHWVAVLPIIGAIVLHCVGISLARCSNFSSSSRLHSVFLIDGSSHSNQRAWNDKFQDSRFNLKYLTEKMKSEN